MNNENNNASNNSQDEPISNNIPNEEVNNAGIPDDDLYIFEDATAAGAPMSISERLAALFTAPGRLGENIKEFPKLGAPLLCVFVLSIISTILSFQIVEIVVNAQSIALAERYGVDFLNMQQAMEAMEGEFSIITNIISFVAVIFGIFSGAAMGAIGIKLITLVMRGSATFMQYFSLIMHTSIITTLGGIIVIALMIATDSYMTFTSLAPILMPRGSMFDPMFLVFSSIEIFGIWAAVVLAICIKKLNPGFSMGKSVAAAAIYYAVSVLVLAGISMSSILIYDFTYSSMQHF